MSLHAVTVLEGDYGAGKVAQEFITLPGFFAPALN